MRGVLWSSFISILIDPVTAFLRVVYVVCICSIYVSFHPADPVVNWTFERFLAASAFVAQTSMAIEGETGWKLPAWTKYGTPKTLARERASHQAKIKEMSGLDPMARHVMFLGMLALFRWLWPFVAFGVLWWIKYRIAQCIWGAG